MPTIFVPYSETDLEHNHPLFPVSQWQQYNDDHELYAHWYWRDLMDEVVDYLTDYDGATCECCREER